MKKKRMDVMLFEQGLVKSIDEARRVIMAGLAIADDKRIDKAGDMVPCDAHIRLKERLPYVSRGGLKLKYAIDYFQLNLKDALVLDIGSSTGGFTDVCLQEGAYEVVAVDSGTAQLHNKLLTDNRVKSFENSNFKTFSFDNINSYCDFIVTDVSFISLCAIIPNAVNFCKEGTIFVPLIKPQFEAAKHEVDEGGIVHNKEVHIKVIKKVIDFALDYGFTIQGITTSPIKGAKGNIEYLCYFLYKGIKSIDNIENLIEKVVYNSESSVNS